ncbi:hypothetical protein T484DRAFT_3628344, partial [Baffinella frigidus]
MPSKPVAVHKWKCLVDGCNRSFRYPSGLKQHDNCIHNGICPNVCDHINEKGEKCGKKFERPDGLIRHTLTHSDGDVKCKDCTATFKTKQERYRHWVTQHSPPNHSARTEYKCKECNHKGFPTSTGLKQHCLDNHVLKDDPRLVARRKARAEADCRYELKKKKERAERAALNSGAPSAFGQIDGVSRDEEIKKMIHRIMGSPAGFHHHHRGEPTTAKWGKHHGSASLRDVLSNHPGNRTFAVYFFQTRQEIKPGEEEKCPESFAFLHE